MISWRFLGMTLLAITVGCATRDPSSGPLARTTDDTPSSKRPSAGGGSDGGALDGTGAPPAASAAGLSRATPEGLASVAFPVPDDTNRPRQVDDHGYTSSESCQACHARQYATWHASYHRTMTQLATPETVRGDFSDVVTQYFGAHQRFYREGDRFLVDMVVTMPGSSSGESTSPAPLRPAQVKLPIALVTGSHHAQVYWHATGRGRLLSMIPYFYLIEERRWIPRNAAFLRPGGPDQPQEWGSWNSGCIRCHATQGQPRFGDPVDTRVAEFGIACEACHGPANQHVAGQREGTSASEGTRLAIANPAKLSHRAASQVCGQCHSVWQYENDAQWDAWNEHGTSYRPGDDLEQERQIVVPSRMAAHPTTDDDRLFLEDRFWSDGMVRVSGREYNGLVDSPCFQRGELSCLSCHTMHQPADDPRPAAEWANDQLKPGMEGNQACTQCHGEFNDSQRLAEHSHHAAGSTGSRCYNCHMPHTTYGILKAIRSHQIDSPDVADSVTVGRPNACNLCHLDQSLQWSAAHLDRWYGIKPPALTDDQQRLAAAPLWLLTGDAGQRALAAWSMSWPAAQQASGTSWMAPFLAQLLTDPYPAVRLLAQRALRKLAGNENLVYDFLGTFAGQQAASRTVRETWERQRPPPTDWPESLRRALDEFSRLAGQRNDRPMNLRE